jgi:chromosome segregation protein
MLASACAERDAAEVVLAEAEAAAAQSAADALLRTLADNRAADATASGLVQSRQALAEQQQRTLTSVARQIQSKQQQAATLELEAADLNERLAVLAEQEANVRHRLEALQAEISPQERALAQIEATESEAAARERKLQHAQRTDESASAHAQLLLQRSEDAVHQLRAEIERDLGLAAMETSGDLAYQPPLPFDAFVEQLPVREVAPEGVEEELVALRGRLSRLVNVNPDAPREYDEAAQRFEHLTVQAEDLESAAADLHRIIAELDAKMQSEFTRTFQLVAEQFQAEFRKLFDGGAAELILTDPTNVAESGIEVIARPPGKRPQSLALLSGGERSLAACALIFAILRVSPTPFCVLDEVDAALDEANVDRFRLAVEDLSSGTQFIIVTHNRRTLEGANTIYGITMGDDGVSKVISLRLEGDSIIHAAGVQNGAGKPGANGSDVANSSATPEQTVDGDLQQLTETITM